jgi:hypothetical protein
MKGDESFEDFITKVLLADTIEDEREIISDEQAALRTIIKSGEDDNRPRTVAKLIYLSMCGENVSWGQMEAVGLMSADRLSHKRVGYLAAGSFLAENMELTVLTTATVQKDLVSTNPRIQKLALDFIANMGTGEMSQSLHQEVARLLDAPDPTIQKRAAMAALTIIRRNPEIWEAFRPFVAKLLNSPSHCCVLAGAHMALQLLSIEPSLRDGWAQFCVACTALLKHLFELKEENEYTFIIFQDPFLQITLLRLLAALKHPSEELDDVLSLVATGSSVIRNAGRSTLLQTVATIAAVAKKPALRSLAFNQVGRLFSHGKQANTLYSALSAFSRILYSEGSILDRSSADSQVLQRYKSEVVSCLSHRDPSIRRRALDVVAALVDETNVETLIPEVIGYVKTADATFRTELVSKIFTSIQRFAPTPVWNFNAVFQLVVDSGSYVSAEVVVAFCNLVARNSAIRPHAIKTLSEALKTNPENQPLLQVAGWAVGEFQETTSDAIDVLLRLTQLPQTVAETKLILITSMAKLAVRFNEIPKVRQHLAQFVKNNNLEVQQRTGELVRVLERPDVSEGLLAPMEVEGEEDVPKPAEHAPGLLEFTSEPKSVKPPKAAPAAARPPPIVTAPPNSVEALKTSDFVVYFEIQKNPANPSQMAVRSSIFNVGAVPLTKFLLQFGASQGWQINAQPPSGNVLGPIGSAPIRQVFYLQNKGTLPLKMIAQATFMYRTQPIKEQHQLNPIFG